MSTRSIVYNESKRGKTLFQKYREIQKQRIIKEHKNVIQRKDKKDKKMEELIKNILTPTQQ